MSQPTNNPMSADCFLTLDLTERQVEINEELKKLQDKERELNIEYEKEAGKAKAKRTAEARFIRYKSYLDAGFDKEQAFTLMNN